MSTSLRAGIVAALLALAACRQSPAASTSQTATTAASAPAAADAVNATVYMCPMDRDIRGYAPGKCPRCGMALVTSVPDPVEYHVDVATSTVPQAGRPTRLSFTVSDPWKGNPVTKFLEVHERLYHAFVVSRDLQFFVHGHPQWNGAAFDYDVTFPKPGMYRVLSDFYPEASAPQLIANTMFVGSGDVLDAAPVILQKDYSPKAGENTNVALQTIPEQPIEGMPTRLRLTVGPTDGIQKYLGVWAHMLAASDDLIDLMHTHPTIADGGAEMEFSVVFPRTRTYRIWVQLQRNDVVNTVHFDVPVRMLPEGPVS